MIAAREQYRGLGDSTVKHRSVDDAVIVTDVDEATITGRGRTRPSRVTRLRAVRGL